MNKTAIKKFAMEARKKLISDIKYKAGLLGITEKGIANALKQSNSEVEYYDIGTKEPYAIQGKQVYQRRSLANAIRTKAEAGDYETAYNSIIEEVAYTWFNRLIAVRFMEVNEYLPCKIRVLSSDEGVPEPEIVQRPFESDMKFSPEEEQIVQDMALANEGEMLFRMLFIKECNELSDILPQLFEKKDDYTELLLNISYNDTEGVVYHLVHDIPEANFNVEQGGQVEIIGWMYQYYNTEPKADVEKKLKGGVKVNKNTLPAKTQLFTPDWIVRYMVENSLGRLWVEGHPNDSLKDDWKYYLEEAEQEEAVRAELAKIREEYAQLNPEDIKLIDPCMGSGHILVYAFDVLMQIYLSVGYTQKEAVISILENNLYGLDIDERAFQLAYFAVMMKARQYYKLVLKKKLKVNIYAIEESNELKDKMHQLAYFGASMDELSRNVVLNQIKGLIDEMRDAKEYGSLLRVSNYDWDLLEEFIEDFDINGELDLFASYGIEATQASFFHLIKVARLLNQTYTVSVTNPPYLGLSSCSSKVNEYVKKHYPDSKIDLFSVFIERCNLFVIKNGFQAMITQHGWMFLGSYDKLRAKILNYTLLCMAHLGARAFEEIGGEVVQTTSFVFRNRKSKDYKGSYVKLVDESSEKNKELKYLECINNNRVYLMSFSTINNIPSKFFGYWLDKKMINHIVTTDKINRYGVAKQGLITADNERFLRLWFEINPAKLNSKWFKYNKGGGFRRWYGNIVHVVNWQNDGFEICNFYDDDGKLKSRPQNVQYYFKKGLTWNDVSTADFCCRAVDESCMFDASGPTLFLHNDRYYYYFLGILNTSTIQNFLNLICQGLHYSTGHIPQIPVVLGSNEDVERLAKENVEIAKKDWDSFETSMDFKRHPLV